MDSRDQTLLEGGDWVMDKELDDLKKLESELRNQYYQSGLDPFTRFDMARFVEIIERLIKRIRHLEGWRGEV